MKIKKHYIYIPVTTILIFILVAVFVNTPYQTGASVTTITDKSIILRFEELSDNGNVFCFGPDAVFKKSESETLKGSCCGEMSLHRYSEQIEGLKKYSSIDKIPLILTI